MNNGEYLEDPTEFSLKSKQTISSVFGLALINSILIKLIVKGYHLYINISIIKLGQNSANFFFYLSIGCYNCFNLE